MKLKRYKKKTLGSYISKEIIIIVLSFLAAILVINKLYYKFNNVVLPLAENEAKKYMTEIINRATNKIEIDKDLFIIERDKNNEIKMVNYDSNKMSLLTNKITNNIQNGFDKILTDNNYIIGNIPMGIIFKNSLLRNFGPNIGIRLRIIGNVISELETEVKPYGINNALMEVRIKIKANAQVVLPLVSKEIYVNNVIPISINIINGSIPEAYISSFK